MSFFSSARRSLFALIIVTSIVRAGWAALVEAGNDEAYNYLYTVHPDLSFFDHPPMMMWISRAGIFLCDGDVELFSLRLGYIVLFAGSTWAMFRLTSRWYGEWAGFYSALALNLAAYYTAAAGAFALPDGPFLFFTLLTIWALSEALVGLPGRILPWVWVGLAWAGALLSKYHAVLLPAAALLYIAATPGARRLLRTPGPYLATAIGLLGFTPVLIWNHDHAWASFAFQGGRALEWKFEPQNPVMVLLGTLFLLTPWIGWALVRSAVSRVRSRPLDNFDRLLLCLAGVPLVFFLAISCGRRVLVHWPLMGFVPLFCLLGQRWAALAESAPRRLRGNIAAMFAVGIVLAGMVLAQSRLGVLDFPEKDPCHEFSGWSSVAEQLQARGLIDRNDKNSFLFTGGWDDSGQLSFALRNQMPVLCYNKGDARGFAFWSRPEDWLGKDGLLIAMDDKPFEPDAYRRFFQDVELVASFPMTRAGRPFRSVRVFRFHHQVVPFPFLYERPSRQPDSHVSTR